MKTFLKIVIASLILLAAFYFLFRDKDSPAPVTNPIAANDVIHEEALPPGKTALEDDGALPGRVSEPVIIGRNDPATPDKTELTTSKTGRSEDLRKVYKNLLVFHADDTMEVNRPKLATLILSKNGTIEKMRVEVLEESDAMGDNFGYDTSMDFGSKMRARLLQFGASKTENSFEIEPLGEDIQTFRTDRNKIIWQWKLTPLKPGQQNLKLTVQVIEKDGEAVSLPARSIPVVIFAKEESVMSKVGDFVEKKYEFLITAIFIPVVVAWFTTRLRNKANSQTITEFHKDTKRRNTALAEVDERADSRENKTPPENPLPPPVPPVV